MSITLRTAGITAAAAAAFVIAGTVGVGAAQALPVQQLPANGLVSGGITDYHTYSAAIRVVAAGPGKVKLSAPAGGQCGFNGVAGTLVRFDYTNITNGRSGSGTVRPCPGPFAGPLEMTLHPGAGTVIGTISIVNSGGWSLPGGATFNVG